MSVTHLYGAIQLLRNEMSQDNLIALTPVFHLLVACMLNAAQMVIRHPVLAYRTISALHLIAAPNVL